jgi:polar amino acid transport system substrate-binding protein
MAPGSNDLTRRRFLVRSAGVGAAVVVGPTWLAACGGDDDDGGVLESARDSGSIRVGFANEAPFGFERDGELTGQAPEVAREIMSQLDVDELEGVLTDFDSLIPGLNAGRFDIVAAGMFITPDRCQQAAFSNPDYCAFQAFGVEQGNPLGIETFEDVADNSDVKLGVLGGAVEAGFARDAGVSGDQLVTLADQTSLVDGLKGGRVDAFALTSISVNWILRNEPALEATEPFLIEEDGEEQVNCGAYVFRPDGESEELLSEFNRVLGEMQENDEILPIVEEFGFGEEEISRAEEQTAEELCAA